MKAENEEMTNTEKRDPLNNQEDQKIVVGSNWGEESIKPEEDSEM